MNCVPLQHKMGADHSEIFSAVPVDPHNRLKDIGPVREVEVRILPSGFTASQSVAIWSIGMDQIRFQWKEFAGIITLGGIDVNISGHDTEPHILSVQLPPMGPTALYR